MSLQIEKLLEEITKSSEEFNNENGMLAEDTTVKADEVLFEEPVVNNIPNDFECVFEDHELEAPLSEETMKLIENINFESQKLLSLLNA